MEKNCKTVQPKAGIGDTDYIRSKYVLDEYVCLRIVYQCNSSYIFELYKRSVAKEF